MQPTDGQIASGNDSSSHTAEPARRLSRMRTIQPLHTGLDNPNSGLEKLTTSTEKPLPQPLTTPQLQQPLAVKAPLHDDAQPHPVAPREAMTPKTPSVDPLHASVPSSQTPSTQIAPAVKSQKPVAPAVSQNTNPLPAPLPSSAPPPVQTPPLPKSSQEDLPPTTTSTPASTKTDPAPAPQSTSAQQSAPQKQMSSAQPTHSNQSQSTTEQPQPTTTATQPPQPPSKPVHAYAHTANETLMRSSNPFGATLSGIEVLIKRNGIVSIGYVSIFLGVTGALITGLYLLGRFAGVTFLNINFPLIAALLVGLLLIATYICSFVVCVASEAGQSLSLHQIFYLARKNLHKLLALQILTIGATMIGLLLGIIPGVIILGRWLMAPFMIFESDHPSVLTAIKRSNKLTKGRTVEMSGLVFAQVLLLSTGILGFAAMAAGPAARYQQLRLRVTNKTDVSKVHILNYLLSILLGISLLAGILGGGYQVYKSNQSVCYSTIKFVSGRPQPVTVCVKRHVCQRDIICRETLNPKK